MTKRDELHRRQARSLGFLLIRCGQLWNERGLRAVGAEDGVPPLGEAHTRLLPHLSRPGGIRITELARTIGVTKQAVQPLVADLALRGIVRLDRDPSDARARRVKLTARGIDAMLAGTGVLEAIEAELAPALGAAEVRALKRGLGRLLRALEGEAPLGAGPRRRAKRVGSDRAT